MIVISVYSLSKKIIFPLSLSLFLSLYYSVLFLQIFSSYTQILIFSSITFEHRDCILQSFKKVFKGKSTNRIQIQKFKKTIQGNRCVDTSFCNLHLTSFGGKKSSFTSEIRFLILVIGSLITYHQSNIDDWSQTSIELSD